MKRRCRMRSTAWLPAELSATDTQALLDELVEGTMSPIDEAIEFASPGGPVESRHQLQSTRPGRPTSPIEVPDEDRRGTTGARSAYGEPAGPPPLQGCPAPLRVPDRRRQFPCLRPDLNSTMYRPSVPVHALAGSAGCALAVRAREGGLDRQQALDLGCDLLTDEERPLRRVADAAASTTSAASATTRGRLPLDQGAPRRD